MTLTWARSSAEIRSVGRGRRTIDVVYHQYGAAMARKRGKQSMTSHRRERGGLIAVMIGAASRPGGARDSDAVAGILDEWRGEGG